MIFCESLAFYNGFYFKPLLFSFPDLSLLIKLYQTMNHKSSIRRKLKKVVVKGLTNGTKHDIIRISKLSVVTFNTDFRRMVMNFIKKIRLIRR